jgi:hypothetical protein
MALMLAKNNSDLRSDGFNAKKAVYKQSPYELTPDCKSEIVGPTEIATRQRTLAKLLAIGMDANRN